MKGQARLPPTSSRRVFVSRYAERPAFAIGTALRMGSATALTQCELLEIDKKAMMLALHRESTFSDLFVAYLLAQNIRYEEDLVDQLSNSSEKRLAGVLLLLAHFGKDGVPESVIPKVSQKTLAEMVGTVSPETKADSTRGWRAAEPGPQTIRLRRFGVCRSRTPSDTPKD